MTGRPPAPKEFPLQPLLDAAGITRGQVARKVRAGGGAVRSAADEGCTASQADMWACRLGFHVVEIWPEYYQPERTAA